tara:strand:+ start:4802 stop:5602 length:801 start_codon:yes stop_codon:yes gene_type:complete
MKLYTVATHNHGYLNSLKMSAKKNGYTLINLARNKKWKGLVWKFKLLYQELLKLDDNEIIAFCDGFDVIVVNSANSLKKNFLRLNCDIIFGKENSNHNTIIHYLSQLCFKYYNLLDRNNIPNSGVYVGYVKKIKQFLKLCLNKIETVSDDQDITYLIYYNQKHYNLNIKLYDEYIYTIPFSKKWTNAFSFNETIIEKITCDLNKVFFVHANGNRNMDIYCKTLKYPLKLNNTVSNHNHFIHYINMLFRNNYKVVLLVIILAYGSKI